MSTNYRLRHSLADRINRAFANPWERARLYAMSSKRALLRKPTWNNARLACIAHDLSKLTARGQP